MDHKMSLQVPRTIDIEFQDVTLTVPQGRKGKKQIVNGVSGIFKSGELTAIMGPSGAGKTTLLNILTGFQQRGVQGKIRGIGSPHPEKSGVRQYKKLSSYILQDDQITPLFTVHEIMSMATSLKLGPNLSEKAKQFLIDDTLDHLGLCSTKDTKCGQLSGGQRKRLSIALELLDNPPIMFLDEPTTGLDSSSSSQCIRMLKNLAKHGRTIVCTIHQPSASLFSLFDHVYVMAEGYCIYQGASLNTVSYLSSVGLNCPQYHNPADYLLEVANGEYGHFTDVLAKAACEPHWRNALKPSKITPEKQDDLNNVVSSSLEDEVKKSLMFAHPPSELYKFHILIYKAILQLYRDWTVTHLKLLLHFMVGIFLGLTYYKVGDDGSKVFTNVGMAVVNMVYLTYTSLMPSILKFPSELLVIKKEKFNNWYNLRTYYMAFLVTDIPLQILFSLVYTTTTYFMSYQPNDWNRFTKVLLVLTLVSLTSSSIGLVLGTSLNPINGTFFGAVITALNLALAGFLIFFPHMSRPLYYLSYVGYMGYSFPALIHAVYGFDRDSIPCPENVDYCLFKSPELILREFGVEHMYYWYHVAILATYFVGLRILAYFTLKRRLSRG